MSHSHVEKGNNCVLKSDHFCLSVTRGSSLAHTVKLNYSLEEKERQETEGEGGRTEREPDRIHMVRPIQALPSIVPQSQIQL